MIPMNCSPPGSSACGILQARILEWVAISFSMGSSQPRDRTQVSCIEGRFFFFFFNRRLITLQYCSGFSIHWHESAMGVLVCPILNPPPTSLPIPSHPSGLSQRDLNWETLEARLGFPGGFPFQVHHPWVPCLMHRTWTGHLFHIRWWTGRPGVLRFMGSQRIGHNWATELNTHVSILFSQIIPPLLSSMESKSLFFTSVSLLLSRI